MELYNKIQERIRHLSDYYNSTSNDIFQNKTLVTQSINEEFYTVKDKMQVTSEEYQLFLNYITPFDPKDWSVYRKEGFYLFLPKQYIAEHSITGFKVENLEEVNDPLDAASNYFDAQNPHSFINALSNFFLTYEDLPNQMMPYIWNIVLSGHGYYQMRWTKPSITNLKVQEFKDVLDFFHAKLKTHLFHYSSCYAGGKNLELVFEKDIDKTYNFAIICECLTDCATYCKWRTMLPSEEKKFLSPDDLYYNSATKSWDLITKSSYEWSKFLNAISKVDFSQDLAQKHLVIKSIERLPKILSFITYPVVSGISLLRQPETNNFYPIPSSDTIKIDDRFNSQTKKNTPLLENIDLHGIGMVLLESDYIGSTVALEASEKIRIISTKPGEAVHYIKKLTSVNHLNLPRVFWQAEYQIYDKTFLIDECSFPHSKNSIIYNDLSVTEKDIVLKNVIIKFQTNFAGRYIRFFFTVNDMTMMAILTNSNLYEVGVQTTLKEIIRLTPEAKDKYEKHYLSLKESINKTTVQ